MQDEAIINRVRSYTTGTPGRSISQARTHQLVIDEPGHAGGPGEEMTPAEAFLAGISACGVLLVEGGARDTGIPLQRVEATIEGVRSAQDTSRFQRINLRFEVAGPSQQQAEELVEGYRRR